MRGTWRNLQLRAGEALLELLHREADQDLTPDEQAVLHELQHDEEVQAARADLRRTVLLLSGPQPPLPRSVAKIVASDVALSARLTAPPLPHSVAADLAGEVALAQRLAAPPLPGSVAASVVADLQAARALGPAPSIPSSVAAAVLADIKAAQVLQTPAMPHSVAPAVLAEIQMSQALRPSPVPAPQGTSAAAMIASRVVAEATAAAAAPPAASPVYAPRLVAQQSLGGPLPPALPPVRNPAPLFLVGALLVGLTLLAVTTAWPNLAAGAVVLRTLLTQVSPLAGVGLLLLLLTSAIITWKPTPAFRTAGAGAFALSAILTIPALYNVAGGANGLSIGHNVTVNGRVQGNVIAIGGNIHLNPSAQVQGEVVTLLGDVHRESGAQVGGHVSALLGHAPGDQHAIQTRPVSDLSLATAAAFRPVLGWLGAAAWPQIFVALTGSLLLLLFLAGAAPVLARRQRHAPMRTLAMGILMLAALTLPALGLGLVGFLGPALLVSALTAVLIATGLSVSVYDAGRSLAHRLNLPVPDAVGSLLGLSAFAASLSYAPLAFALALIGGTWGAGTLLLNRKTVHGMV